MDKMLLIIFYRNPELGKVKTRLAATLGDEKALAIYLKLIDHTRLITEDLAVHKVVCYSHYIDGADNWLSDKYEKQLQKGVTLGERLHNAVKTGFENNFDKVCVIGSDCFELSSDLINQAFAVLETKDTVIGPAKDGGYYLLGMKKLIPDFFLNKEWSTESVFESTIEDFKKLNLSYHALPPLNDVDFEKDLPLEIRAALKA